jgi:hypothetical protein
MSGHIVLVHIRLTAYPLQRAPCGSYLAAYNHPNMTRTLGFIASGPSAVAIQVVLDGGELGEVSCLQSPLEYSSCFCQPDSLTTLVTFAVDMLRVLTHLADNVIVHRCVGNAIQSRLSAQHLALVAA